MVNNDILGGDRVLIQSLNVAGAVIGQRSDLFEGPGGGVMKLRVFASPVHNESGSGMEQVEGVPELAQRSSLMLNTEQPTPPPCSCEAATNGDFQVGELALYVYFCVPRNACIHLSRHKRDLDILTQQDSPKNRRQWPQKDPNRRNKR